MKDPSSTQFRQLQAVTLKDGTVRVCGQVNAKNSFGGYNGFSAFTGDLAAGQFWLQLLDSNTNRYEGFAAEKCRKSGFNLIP